MCTGPCGRIKTFTNFSGRRARHLVFGPSPLTILGSGVPPRPPCSGLPTQQNPFFPSRTLVQNTTGVESAAGTHPKASSSFKRRSTTNKRSGRIDVYDHPKASSVHLHDSSFHGQPMPEARRNVNTHTGSFAGEVGFEVLRALAAFGLFLEQKAVHAAPLWWRDSAARAHTPQKGGGDSPHRRKHRLSCGGHTACGLLLCQQVVLRLLVAGCLVLRACLPAVQSPLLTAATLPLVWSCGMNAFWRSPCPLSHLSTHTSEASLACFQVLIYVAAVRVGR